MTMKTYTVRATIAVAVLFLAASFSFGQGSYIGEIRIVPYNFAPQGWADCDGQILSISSNTALFSILGTMYGGNGTSTFALPNLNGSVAVDAGQGPGLSPYVLGQSGGESSVTLTTDQMPSHSHVMMVDTVQGTSDSPVGNLPATNAVGAFQYAASGNGQMNSSAVATVGGGQPHNNMMPYLGLKFIIAVQGVYPPRSANPPAIKH